MAKAWDFTTTLARTAKRQKKISRMRKKTLDTAVAVAGAVWKVW
jgi:hypothetical protein